MMANTNLANEQIILKSDEPKSLEQLVPRWFAFGCALLWLAIAALVVSNLSSISPISLGIFAVLAVATSSAAIYAGIRGINTLRNELTKLAELADNSRSADEAEFGYSEFSEIAARIDNKNRTYRDEMENLRRAAFRDPVTGLPNRLSLIETMEKGLTGANHNSPCAVFHLILNGHNHSGDVLGATGGQKLQSEVATRLSLYFATLSTGPQTALRDLFLASLGASQFGLFMPVGCGRDEATSLVRELGLLFEQPFTIDGRDIFVSLSGGIAIAPDDGGMPEMLLKNASMALNEILRAGKCGFQFFSPRLERLALGRTRFEQELRDAVHAEAFHPVFQPKIDLATNKIVGVEALARWRRGENRVISPGTFIPLAEELGLIEEIGFQILRQSCHSAAEWLKAGMEVSVAVNVSPRQFERSDFIDQIIEALRTSGLPPHLLELEITETMAVSNPERVSNVMAPLRAMGIKLAIDDFGTGHANLSLLTQLPFDVFKIDRQFVMNLEEDEQAPAIVEMILAMAETLGLKTVAEGIETEGQADFLSRRNCTLGQGFLYSRGIPDLEFRQLMANWQRDPALTRQAS